jgi:hypothetical protein
MHTAMYYYYSVVLVCQRTIPIERSPPDTAMYQLKKKTLHLVFRILVILTKFDTYFVLVIKFNWYNDFTILDPYLTKNLIDLQIWWKSCIFCAEFYAEFCLLVCGHIFFFYFISINPVGSTVSCGCGNCLGYKYSTRVRLVIQ